MVRSLLPFWGIEALGGFGCTSKRMINAGPVARVPASQLVRRQMAIVVLKAVLVIPEQTFPKCKAKGEAASSNGRPEVFAPCAQSSTPSNGGHLSTLF